MKTEYTVFQVHSLCRFERASDERIGATIAYAGAINEAFNLAVAGQYAMMGMGYNDTSSRPPKDLGGVSAVYACFGKAAVQAEL